MKNLRSRVYLKPVPSSFHTETRETTIRTSRILMREQRILQIDAEIAVLGTRPEEVEALAQRGQKGPFLDGI